MKSVWQKKTRLPLNMFFLLYLIFDNAFIFHVFCQELCFIGFLKRTAVVVCLKFLETLNWMLVSDQNRSLGCDSRKFQWQTYPYVVLQNSVSSLFRPHEQPNSMSNVPSFWIVEMNLMVVLKNHALGHNLHYGTLFGACDKRKTICTCTKTVFSKHLSLASITN